MSDFFDNQSSDFWDWVHNHPEEIKEWVLNQELITVDDAIKELESWADNYKTEPLFMTLKANIDGIKSLFELFNDKIKGLNKE